MKNEATDWENTQEGPFGSKREADRFADMEVGYQWRVRRTAAGWIIETSESLTIAAAAAADGF